MGIKPDNDGYGAVTKLLHWATLLAMVAQFVVGYAMDRADDLSGTRPGSWSTTTSCSECTSSPN